MPKKPGDGGLDPFNDREQERKRLAWPVRACETHLGYRLRLGAGVVERGFRLLFDNRFLPGKLRVTDDWREGRLLDPRQGSSPRGTALSAGAQNHAPGRVLLIQ